MEETSKRRWTTIVFFSALLILFSGFIYFLIFVPKDSRYSYRRWQSSSADNAPMERYQPKEQNRIVLPLNQPINFEDLILTYKGKQGRSILLDVIIPELDPSVAYHHAIPVSEAKKEFYLASRRFKLTSSSYTLIRIKRLN